MSDTTAPKTLSTLTNVADKLPNFKAPLRRLKSRLFGTNIDINPNAKKKKKNSLVLHPEYRKLYSKSVAEWMEYQHKEIVFDRVHWMGKKSVHNVLDLWVYQEIIAEKRPDTIIEIGANMGGTTLYLAHLLDLVGHGQVVTVDLQYPKSFPEHDRIKRVTGSSTEKSVIEQCQKLVGDGTCMVIHDGDHSKKFVLQDLTNFGPMVTSGQYFIVCDGMADVFHPKAKLGKGYDGPLLASTEFLKTHPEFQIDKEREKYQITHNPEGYLLKQ